MAALARMDTACFALTLAVVAGAFDCTFNHDDLGPRARGDGGNSGGSGGGDGGNATGGSGTGGNGGASSGAADMISDFEDSPGEATMDPNGDRTGYWYVYFPGSDSNTSPPSGMSISPAQNNGRPVATEKDVVGNALHFTGSGYGGTSNNYAGTGAFFKPHAYPDKANDAYDVSKYTGISFKIKAGSGTPPAMYVEMLAKESQPASAGGTATSLSIDLYNPRGQMVVSPWTPNNVSSSWQTVTVPFGTLIPRWLPTASTCPAAGSVVPKCQAAPFVPSNALAIQMSFYRDNGWPNIVGSTAGTFDIWIDDVQFTTDDSGLQKLPGFPLSESGDWGSCFKPQGVSAAAKYLVPAYNLWKASFVRGNKVIRPENGDDTVSEGIAFGMLIAVNMHDQALFDSLYEYWKGNDAGGGLMTACIPAGLNSCSASGGSATGADEDAAFALLQADKVFGGGSYKLEATNMIASIWSNDIDKTSYLPTGGSNSPDTSSYVTSPSYFAPAYYNAFRAAGDSKDWPAVIKSIYGVIGGSLAGSNGLLPGLCSKNCTASNGASTYSNYQYDSHRIPMRIALDYCWNNTTAAMSYVTMTTAFFANQAKDGMGRVPAIFTPAGDAATTTFNSASLLGTAAVGAMAAGNQAFLNDAYQAVFDLATRATLEPADSTGVPGYSYRNATVGLLSLLIMTGNFSH